MIALLSALVAVNLGLSVDWAPCNVGASEPWEYGTYFKWEEISVPEGWRAPSYEEMEELMTSCTWTWGEMEGHKGFTVTGPSGNSIFLTTSGFRSGGKDISVGTWAYLWSGTPSWLFRDEAMGLVFGREGEYRWYTGGRDFEFNVRAVKDVPGRTSSIASEASGSISQASGERPSYQRPAVEPSAKPKIIAHTGYWRCEKAGFTPNSLASLRCAQEAGFWGSEFDVNMTADGEILVFHNAAIDGKCINDYPYSEFADVRLKNGEPIPTLDQYLSQAEKCASTKLIFEIKYCKTCSMEAECVQICLDKLAAHGLLSPDRVQFISFSANICRVLAQLAPDFDIQFINYGEPPYKTRLLGANGVDLYYTAPLRNLSIISSHQNAGITVNVWTVDSPSDMKTLIDAGINQLTTNEPMQARELLNEF